MRIAMASLNQGGRQRREFQKLPTLCPKCKSAGRQTGYLSGDDLDGFFDEHLGYR